MSSEFFADYPKRDSKFLEKAFALHGRWWLPSKPDDQVPGELAYDPDSGLSLKLHGALIDPGAKILEGKMKLQPGTVPMHVVQGLSQRGDKLTLFRCRESAQYQLGSGKFHATGARVDASIGIFGNHYDSESDVRVYSIRFSIRQLTSWLGWQCITISSESSESNAPASIEFCPDSIRLHDVSLPHAKVRIRLGWSSAGLPNGGRTLEPEHIICLELKSDIDFDQAREEVHQFLTFIEFCTGVSPRLNGVAYGTTAKGNDKYDYLIGVPTGTSLRPHAAEMPVPYPAIEDRFELTLKKWYELYRSPLNAPLDLLLGVLKSDEMHLDYHLLAIAQGLESFHAKSMDSSIVDKQTRKRVQAILHDSIPNDIPDDFRGLLNARIPSWHNKSLQDRIRDLLDILNPIYRSRYFPDSADFAQVMSKCRNSLSHGSPDPEMTVERKFFLLKRGLLLLYLLFADRLELKPEVLMDYLPRCRAFRPIRTEFT